jgi:predicted amidophosphoribosyltransferase
MAFCTQCGTKLEVGLKFCTNCGAKIDVASSPQHTVQQVPLITKTEDPLQSVYHQPEIVIHHTTKSKKNASTGFGKAFGETTGTAAGCFAIVVAIIVIFVIIFISGVLTH